MLVKFYSKYKNQLVLNGQLQKTWGESYLVRKLKKLGYVAPADTKDFIKFDWNELILVKKQDCFRSDYADDIYFLNEKLVNDPSDYEYYGIYKCYNCDDYYIPKYNSDDCTDYEGNHYCCESCLDSACFYCDDCDEWYPSSDYDYYRTHDDRTICSNCRNDYFYCDDCGELFHNDDAWELHGDYYCHDCYNDRTDNKKKRGEYHSTRNRGFTIHYATFEQKNVPLLIGTELETTCTWETDDVVEAVADVCNETEDLFGFEYDSSVCRGCEGYEMVSQPCSFNRWIQQKDLIKKTLQTMIDNTCKSHDSHKSCGLHIHFNRDYINDDETTIAKIVYIFEKLKPQLIKFSRRTEGQVEDWAAFIDAEFFEDCLDYVAENNKGGDRYHAVNVDNDDTIEIRLFKGTLKFESYYSCLELVRNIVDYAKEKEVEDIENITFDEVVNYETTEFLKDYCLERELI